MQPLRADAGARGRRAGDAVARGDVRIRAVIDVEQRALRALEQQAFAAAPCARIEPTRNVGDQRLEAFARARASRRSRLLEIHRLGAEVAARARNCGSRALRAAFARSARASNRSCDADRAARDLVLVGGADAAPGRADLRVALRSPRAPGPAPRGTAGSADRLPLISRRDATSTPAACSSSISASSAFGDSTTPLPM